MAFGGETVGVPGESPLPKTVLVVDDEQVVLDVLKIALKKGGYPVTCVSSGEEAFEALAKEQFGAVLTDKNLPGKNGLEIIKEARRLYPYCACLVMTGYANTESVVESMRLGANDYLEKPFSELGLVLQRLKAAFDHQRVMFERAALAEGLRYMEQTLKSRDKEVFQHRTELELLQHVVEVRIDDATRDLVVQTSRLESERGELLERVAKLLQRDVMIAQVLADAAEKCGRTAKKNNLTVEKAKELLIELERQLTADSETLKE
jgi:DNA-binding response OmpR family regulator